MSFPSSCILRPYILTTRASVLQRMVGRAQHLQCSALEAVVLAALRAPVPLPLPLAVAQAVVALAVPVALVVALAVRRFGKPQGISSARASVPEEQKVNCLVCTGCFQAHRQEIRPREISPCCCLRALPNLFAILACTPIAACLTW